MDTKPLSPATQKLLNQLVSDYTNKMKLEDRGIFDIKDRANYIYNLFRGNYDFSSAQYNELFEFLCKG